MKGAFANAIARQMASTSASWSRRPVYCAFIERRPVIGRLGLPPDKTVRGELLGLIFLQDPSSSRGMFAFICNNRRRPSRDAPPPRPDHGPSAYSRTFRTSWFSRTEPRHATLRASARWERNGSECGPVGSATTTSAVGARTVERSAPDRSPTGRRCTLAQQVSAKNLFPISAQPGSVQFVAGCSAIMHSMVSNNPAMDAAFCSAVRVTFVGSTTPAFTRSSYFPVATL